MKSRISHLASLALNAILAITALVLVLHGSGSAPAPTPSEPATTVDQPKLAKVSRSPQFMADASRSDQRRWLVDQLRAMGVPNKILARIVQQDIDASWTKYAGELTLKCHGDSDTMAALQLEID